MSALPRRRPIILAQLVLECWPRRQPIVQGPVLAPIKFAASLATGTRK